MTRSGRERASARGNATSSAAYENHDILSWTFGRAGTGTSLQGGLDEFRLYNRALTPCEVSAIYHAVSSGKYCTNVLVCPVVTEVTLSNALSGIQRYTFTNGVSWVTNGPHWETNVISFSTSTNATAIIVRGLDPYLTNSPYSGNNLNAGWGAWELCGRVTYLNLNDGTGANRIQGGAMNGVGLGVNWYLCRDLKVQFEWNYDHRYSLPKGSIPGDTSGFGIETQLSF